jgi:chromosomal replication initiation ATPase DnaA
VDDVCAEYGVKVQQITGPLKGGLIVCEARHFICYFAHRRGFSFSQIGRFLGNRDPSTVMNSVQRATELLARAAG